MYCETSNIDVSPPSSTDSRDNDKGRKYISLKCINHIEIYKGSPITSTSLISFLHRVGSSSANIDVLEISCCFLMK